RLLYDGRDRLDVGAHGPGRAVGSDRQLRASDLGGERPDVRAGTRPCARQTDVRGVDAQLAHEVQDLDLSLDRRVRDGRALEPVTERLVVELDGAEPTVVDRVARTVPVVDQVLLLHVPSPGKTWIRIMDRHARSCQTGAGRTRR